VLLKKTLKLLLDLIKTVLKPSLKIYDKLGTHSILEFASNPNIYGFRFGSADQCTKDNNLLILPFENFVVRLIGH